MYLPPGKVWTAHLIARLVFLFPPLVFCSVVDGQHHYVDGLAWSTGRDQAGLPLTVSVKCHSEERA